MQLDESIILLGEQLAHGSGVRDCSKCGYLSHQWGSAGLHSRAGVFINYMDAGIECTLSLSMIPRLEGTFGSFRCRQGVQ